MKKLTCIEIDVLREFILKRGFQEPKIASEILDHFVCKTEEIWTAHPAWTFAAAAEAAHKSFGYAGFRPLAEAAAAGEQLQYDRFFWKSLTRNLFNARWFLVALLQVFGYVVLRTVSEQHRWQFLADDFGLPLTYMVILLGFYNACTPRISRFQYQFIERLGGTTGEWIQFLLTNALILVIPGTIRLVSLALAAYVWLTNREVKILMAQEDPQTGDFGQQKLA